MCSPNQFRDDFVLESVDFTRKTQVGDTLSIILNPPAFTSPNADALTRAVLDALPRSLNYGLFWRLGERDIRGSGNKATCARFSTGGVFSIENSCYSYAGYLPTGTTSVGGVVATLKSHLGGSDRIYTGENILFVVNTDAFSVNIPDDEKYTPVTSNLTVDVTLSWIANGPITTPANPVGSHSVNRQISMACTTQPAPLTISTSADIVFGRVQIGSPSSITREFSVNITSGTNVPTGTITFSSPGMKSNGRVNLNGGEVSIWNTGETIEYAMGQAIPITARDTTFVANLSAVGATPGEVTESMIITMTVN